MRFGRWFGATLAAGVIGLLAMPPLWAQATSGGVVGAPKPWELGMQQAADKQGDQGDDHQHEVMELHLAFFQRAIGLLLWVIFRHNAKRNPIPSQTTHHTVLEVIWTVAPVLILVVIAIPSFRLVYYQDRTEHPDMTIKVTGHQWYWEYSYPDQGNLDVESRYVADEDLKPGDLRLLTVDKQMVIPVGKRIRVLTASADVIHSFFVPSMGVQRYAIPGREIETWFEASVPGTFYGECNQICGENHSRMPISIRAVPQPEFDAWVATEKKSAEQGNTPRIVADNTAAKSQLKN